MREMRNACRILVKKSFGKHQVGRPRRKWYIIKTDVRELVWEGGRWMQLGSLVFRIGFEFSFYSVKFLDQLSYCQRLKNNSAM
jgi:hypothetical protein